ncbi:MAG: universal stress protein [Rhodospirillales bacterium]|nr:universal stress protein [Rhodospirillales bacterium]
MTDTGTSTDPRADHVAGEVKFLVCVDGSPPSRVATHYACRRARTTNGRVALLHVVQPVDFRQWSGVEEMMREERRGEAEDLLNAIAADVNGWAGVMPELMVREGRIGDEVLGAIDDDPTIDLLCVGSNPEEGRGRLVSFLAGHLAGRLTIPLVVVPGTLTDETIINIT